MMLKALPQAAMALAIMLVTTSSSAVETLGPNEAIAGVTWTTTGSANLIDGGGREEMLETIAPDSPQTIVPGSLSVVIVDTVTFAIRNVQADPSDPFWATQFDFEPIALDEALIPLQGSEASVPYLGLYGQGELESLFATAFYANTGLINGFMFPVSAPTGDLDLVDPNVAIAGRSAVIDCCQGFDQWDLSYATPSESGRWIDLDGDTVADVNLEEILANSGQHFGDARMQLTNVAVSCDLLPSMRSECAPRSRSLATTFTIPVRIIPPAPEICDVNDDEAFNPKDIKLFYTGCKQATANWACDLDENGSFGFSDAIRFVLGCLANPLTRQNVDDVSAQLRGLGALVR